VNDSSCFPFVKDNAGSCPFFFFLLFFLEFCSPSLDVCTRWYRRMQYCWSHPKLMQTGGQNPAREETPGGCHPLSTSSSFGYSPLSWFMLKFYLLIPCLCVGDITFFWPVSSFVDTCLRSAKCATVRNLEDLPREPVLIEKYLSRKNY